MGRPVLKIAGYTSDDIKALINKDERYTIGIKLYAIYQLSLGVSSRKLENLYHTSFKQILNWAHRFEQEGVEGLRDKKGRGRKSSLSEEQLNTLADILENKSPTEYGYNTETWTGSLIIDWIRKEYKIEYKKAQIYNIIKKLGFTHQKAKGFYPEADPIAQEEFKENLKKKILNNPPDTVLLFEDEFSLSNTATIGYKWGKKGCQPKIMSKQKDRQRKTAIGSYNYESGQITVSFHDKGNYKSLKRHLKKVLLVYKNHTKIIMVLDNVRYHHAKLLKKWLVLHPKLELVYLPPYSPELNPIERAWWYMRKKITHNRYTQTLKERVAIFWRMFSHFNKPNEELKKVCEINY